MMNIVSRTSTVSSVKWIFFFVNLIADYIIDSDRDLFYSADKSITFAFVPGYDSGTDVKEGE